MKTLLVKLALQCCLFTILVIPSACIGPISRIFARLYSSFRSRDRDLLDSNVARVYGLPSHSNYSKLFRRQVFQSQMTIFLETIKSNFSSDDRVIIQGLEELQSCLEEIRSTDRGLIVVTAHLGSWEFVAKYVAKANQRKFYALAKPSKLPEFTEFLDRLRARVNTVVLWTDSKNLLREMMKVLKNGDALGFVMDQKPEGRIGPEVRFLGHPTEFVSGPAKLAIRQQCPVLAVFCMRTGPWHYRLIHQVIVKADHGIQDEVALTQSMAQAIETCVRRYPEQWVWNYKRWRISKNNTPSLSGPDSPSRAF